MNTDQIADQIASGASVAEIAREIGKTPGAVYAALRRSGVPVASLRDETQPGVEYRPIPGMLGYRAGDDGTIQSCASTSGELSDNWRTLSYRKTSRGALQVRIGSEGKGQRTHGARKLLVAAWGEERGVQIFKAIKEQV